MSGQLPPGLGAQEVHGPEELLILCDCHHGVLPISSRSGQWSEQHVVSGELRCGYCKCSLPEQPADSDPVLPVQRSLPGSAGHDLPTLREVVFPVPGNHVGGPRTGPVSKGGASDEHY